MDKDYILNHIDDFSAQQLFEFISQGIVTLQELRKTENLDATKRNAIVALQTAGEREDNAAWEQARYGNETSLRDYITRFPAGIHVAEARQRIDDLENQRRNILAQKQGILDNIRRNPNSYSPNAIKVFLNNRTFTEAELRDYCGIPQSAINNLDNINPLHLDLGATPDTIPDGYTEVYFWGYKGSGKTCALGAILQMAQQKKYLNLASGEGYDYATQIKNIFSNNHNADDFLPAPTPLESNQYLPFTLTKPNESKSRSVSLIEVSGEIFLCFAKKIAGKQFPTQAHENTFNSLEKFLRTRNRKIHFFFIDYGRENRRDDNGYTQSDYLAAASTYFDNNKVFEKTTDAIFVVLTKSDLMLDKDGNHISDDKRVEYAIEHLNGNNYGAFIETLKKHCKKYSINGGKLTVEPFSLGKVYFRDICDFDGSSAANIVEILMERIAGSKKSIFDVFNK
ncbi:MAG: hypothetical protein LBL13_12765 [Bacteroidales bacterium]|jgi:hypothetical protein|nr:hypothetical protein [Bacteroidales bacterium]